MTQPTRKPPYLRCVPETRKDVLAGEFRFFQSHPSLPFAMRRDFYESGETSGLFRHLDFLALYVVRGGRGVHYINGRPYGLVRGDVYLMAPGATHGFRQFAGLELDAFFFQNPLFHAEELAALRELPGLWRLFAGDAGAEPRIHLTPEEWRATDAQIEVMRNEWGDASRAAGLRLKHEFFSLLVALARLIDKNNPAPAISSGERSADSGVAEAVRFCEEHFAQPLSVPELAARAFLSPVHFSRLFIRETGMPPGAYLRRIRLEKARALLKETAIPVAQIASDCGFKNAAQFSRAFHNFYNHAPLQYRKKETDSAVV